MPAPQITFPIPASIQPIMAAIQDAGGEPFLIGGFVRDVVLNRRMPDLRLVSKDHDLEVFGLSLDRLLPVLARFGRPMEVGQAFGIVKLLLPDGEVIDVALPRRERKNGEGHTSFEVETDPSMTFKEAASRRDFTINAMGIDADGNLRDPWGGWDDIGLGMLRHVGLAFGEDPLRVLRAMSFASRFPFLTIPFDTQAMMRGLLSEFHTISRERLWMEFEKWARGVSPGNGLRVLELSGWLSAFPILSVLVGTRQDRQWHPEGDAWAHTRLSVDAAATFLREMAIPDEWRSPNERLALVFAALLHDVGKPRTTTANHPDGRIRSHGHALVGAPLAEVFLNQIGAPLDIIRMVVPLVREHMIHTGALPNKRLIRRLSVRIAPANMRMLAALATADASGRDDGWHSPMARWEAVAREVGVADGAPQPLIKGRHLLAMGFEPGPMIGGLVKAAFEAQLEGVFESEQAGVAWLQANIRP